MLWSICLNGEIFAGFPNKALKNLIMCVLHHTVEELAMVVKGIEMLQNQKF
jgi:hypothetical protein